MFFVYYSDDYYEMGGVGLESFDEEEKALSFIKERMTNKKSDLKDYTLIKGEPLKLKAVEVITEIAVEE